MNRSKREIVSAITAQLNELVEQEERAARQPTDLCREIRKRDYTRPEFAEKCGVGMAVAESKYNLAC